MRISDWSSDVCSSDLVREDDGFRIDERLKRIILPERIDLGHIGDVEARLLEAGEIGQNLHPVEERSEEHRSELQSLLRRSYAVFCFRIKTMLVVIIPSRTV